ncbi:MAG: right-handed parallel beta-helix repeat-containing protein, partial [Pirellulales bacterium]
MHLPFLGHAARSSDGCRGRRARLLSRPIRLEPLEDRRLLSAAPFAIDPIDPSAHLVTAPPSLPPHFDCGLDIARARPAAANLTQIIYVDADAPGASDGSSWHNAYRRLQDALALATAGKEIRVAQGVYTPDHGGGRAPGDRLATFQLLSGVALRGGYAGFGAPDPNAHDVAAFETVFSGDLRGDDATGGNGENSYHVVYAPNTVDASAILDGFTIRGGNANGADPNNRGGGLYTYAGSPTVLNCTFRDNVARGPRDADGGGLWNYQGSPTVNNCSFIANSADDDGGGLWSYEGSPTVINCSFLANVAESDAGGMFNYSGSPTVTNCLFSANIAGGGGGAFWNYEGDPTLTNCTIFANAASHGSGGVWNYDGSAAVVNSILWGNTVGARTDESAQITTVAGQPRVAHNCIQGLSRYQGNGNTGDDPLLVNPVQGDYHLQRRSPCIDAGDSTAVPPAIVTDLGGNPRIRFGSVDMGAYEYQLQHTVYVDTNARGANDGTSWANAFVNLQDGLRAAATTPSIDEIRVAEGTYRPAGADGPRTAAFQLVSNVVVYGSFPTGGGTTGQRDPAAHPTILSGDLNGDDAAVAEVQDLLSEPTRKENCYHVVTMDSGVSATTLDGFTITAGNADGGYPNNYGGGVYGRDDNGGVTLTRCTIVGNTAAICGGGMAAYCDLSKCLIRGNASGQDGGGVDGALSLSDCTISGNWAVWYGGGMQNARHVTRCQFIENSAHDGGAISNATDPLTDCTFLRNSASDEGGAIYTWDISPTLDRCTFIANTASYGGALSQGDCDSRIVNCQFLGNSADMAGAVGHWGYSESTLVNSLFSGNRAETGGAVHLKEGSVAALLNCTFSLNTGGGLVIGDNYGAGPAVTNCIFWGNRDSNGTGESAQISFAPGEGTVSVNFSCVQGWSGTLGGTGNLGGDPRFIDADGADNLYGMADDNLRLLAGSPAINAGDNAAVLASVTTDLDGNPRIVATIVDMGAYEFQGPRTWYVDDNAPADPGPSDPAVSDPLENGTVAHRFDAIQEAIDAAQNGDTVLVLDGRYTGSGNRDMDFLGKGITVRSENGPANTVIDVGADAQNRHRGFSFHTGETPSAIVQGLTITNGYADNGGAIRIVAASPRIEDCVIQGNQAVDDGGGIYADGGAAVIANSTISGNRADDGAGIAADRGASITVTGCTISGNDAADDGGGLYLRNSNPLVTLSTIVGNEATEGGGIRCSGGSPTITDSTIADNEAPYVGGGGIFLRSSDALIARCLFRNNGT